MPRVPPTRNPSQSPAARPARPGAGGCRALTEPPAVPACQWLGGDWRTNFWSMGISHSSQGRALEVIMMMAQAEPRRASEKKPSFIWFTSEHGSH